MNFVFILRLEVTSSYVMMYTIKCLVEYLANGYAAFLKAVMLG